MVGYPASADAAAYASRTSLGIGLHLDLGEWTRLGDTWRAVYVREQTAEEIESQLGEFRRLVGCDPTHIDSHQHVHSDEPVRSICLRLARDLGVPLRHFSGIRYEGAFYGQASDGTPLLENICVDGLIGFLHALPEGTTELVCHPADAEDVQSSYGVERTIEVETLCDLRVRLAIEREGIELRSFRDAMPAIGAESSGPCART
jgi:predicted glycoside hydrolase/deacetylase ChbG (UPF0249 family)